MGRDERHSTGVMAASQVDPCPSLEMVDSHASSLHSHGLPLRQTICRAIEQAYQVIERGMSCFRDMRLSLARILASRGLLAKCATISFRRYTSSHTLQSTGLLVEINVLQLIYTARTPSFSMQCTSGLAHGSALCARLWSERREFERHTDCFAWMTTTPIAKLLDRSRKR